MAQKKIDVGDWVRFYRNGVLVIGVVEYVKDEDDLGEQHFYTTEGDCDSDDVLEVRKASR